MTEHIASDEKLAKRRITAKEAKEIADNSIKTLSQIYKIIHDEAEAGRVRLDWSADYTSKKCLNNIIETLKADGYTVSDENHMLVIQW